MFQPPWNNRFLALAHHIAQWSKDPSTKVGAVIVRPNKTIASVGYNGFPRGVDDSHERLSNREQKYPRVVHAEANAILNCPERPIDCHLYVTLAPCAPCASLVIQSGIKRVYFPRTLPERWMESNGIALSMFAEAAVRCMAYDENSLVWMDLTNV